MLRRSLLDEVGLFDEEMPACEDYDLWLRISHNTLIYLINNPLTIKEGGHPDQLSRKYRGMDRFRIKSIVKIIRSGKLTAGKLKSAFSELERKCDIYGKGCIKRGKFAEAEAYLSLSKRLRKGDASLPPLMEG
jgi:hypothetical protein